MTGLAHTPLGFALIGLILGMRHATDSDHVIAITAILSREQRLTSATRIGIAWGIGHTITVLAVGSAIILLKIAIPARIGLAMEFAVALMLIAIGTWTIVGARRKADYVVHSHPHQHGELVHPHVHAHVAGEEHVHQSHLMSDQASSSPSWRNSRAGAFAAGLVHGLAGSAAIALLVLTAIPDAAGAVVYLMIFGAGTIIGMSIVTTAIGIPMALATGRMRKMQAGFSLGAGLVSIAFGFFLAYQIGYVDGLFSAAASWPR